jgi:uncharacterized membrane protein
MRNGRSELLPSRAPAAICLGAVIAAAAPLCRAQATFDGLGVPPGALLTRVHGISADGSTAVGEIDVAGQVYLPFRWTATAGIVVMDPMTGGTRASVQAASADGSALAGQGDSGVGYHAFRWTPGGGYELLPPPPGAWGLPYGVAISGDGSVVVGYWNGPGATPWMWTAAGGTVAIADRGYATGVSADGRIIGGADGAATGDRPFRWTEAGLAHASTPTPWDFGFANGISGDGAVLVGYVQRGGFPTVWAAFRWSEAQGFVELPRPAGGSAIANAASADGSVIVGTAGVAAYAWTPLGAVDLRQHLMAAGVSLQGWTMSEAYGVSADGRTIVGVGTDPAGRADSWVVHLPPGFGCYANCDGSTGSPVLTIADFSCFLNRFASGDSSANCDGSTTEPVLNVADFACFLNRFAAGCG